MPWKDARVHFHQLSEDNIHQAYIVKEFSKHWDSWLGTEYTFGDGNSANSLIGESLVILCAVANHLHKCYPIVDSTDTLVKTDNILPLDELNKTEIYKELVNNLKNLSKNDIDNLKKMLAELTSIVEIGQDNLKNKQISSIPSAQKLKSCCQNLAPNGPSIKQHVAETHGAQKTKKMYVNAEKVEERFEGIQMAEEEDLETIAGFVSTLLLFWPYHQLYNPDSFGFALEKELQTDLHLFSTDFASSVTQQMLFVQKIIQHIGHERLYAAERIISEA